MKAKETLYGILTDLKKVNDSSEVEKLSNDTMTSFFRKDVYASDIKVSDELFSYFPDDLRDRYLTSYDLSEAKFEMCSPVLKGKYIQRCIKNGWNLSPNYFNWCSDELRKKFISKTTKDKGKLEMYQFDWCSDDLKKEYLLALLEDYSKSHYHRCDRIFDYMDLCKENLITFLLEKVLSKKQTVSDNYFRKFSESNKSIYISSILDNNYQLSDPQFISCSEKLKEDYLFKTKKLSELQIDYLRNNYCKH